MRNAIRSLLVLVLSLAFLVPLTASASALGPGGWDNLGNRGVTLPNSSALDARVDVLNTDMPGKLIAGGAFNAAGQPAANTVFDDHIAIWDGTAWSPLRAGAGAPTDGLNGDVRAIAFDTGTGKIYAGGQFTNAGGDTTADGLAVWDTTAGSPSWQPFCSPSPNGAAVDALEIVGSTLYVGGPFANWGGPAINDWLIACPLAGGAPTAMHTADGLGGGIRALAVDSSGDLYAGGAFINWNGDTAADYVVKYDLPGTAPSALVSSPAQPTPGIDSSNVDSLATIGNHLYVGTDDINIDGIPQADNVVRWDGSDWGAVGSDTAGTNGYFSAVTTGAPDVQALTTSGANVFASGGWNNANGDPLSDDVARFDGATWDNVGSNGALNNGPLGQNLARGLAVYANKLVVGGNFADAGGDPLADSIACNPVFLFATPCVTAPVVTPTPTPTPLAVAGPTGKRAAALKKCKNKDGAAKTRCKKRAKKLPV